MLLTVSLSLLALAPAGPQARKAEPDQSSLVLEGVWMGHEIGAVGSLHPTVTFTGDGGTLAYTDSSGGTGQLKMRLQAFRVEGPQVHFAVPGGGRLKHYSGRWDGRRITGTISADAAGTQPIGTFELRRAVYDRSRSPSGEASASASPEAEAAASSASEPPPGESEGKPAQAPATPPPSQMEREREAGRKRVEKRLGQISDDATRMEAGIGRWRASCREGVADVPEGYDCDGMMQEIGRLGFAVSKGLDEVEDEARRSWMEPGEVRELRAQYGLDGVKWDVLSRKARELEAEWKRRKR